MKLTIAEMEYMLEEMINSKWFEKPTKSKREFISIQRNLIHWLKNTDQQAVEANYNLAYKMVSTIEKRLPVREDFKFDVAYENATRKVKEDYNASYWQKHFDAMDKIVKLLKKHKEWKEQ